MVYNLEKYYIVSTELLTIYSILTIFLPNDRENIVMILM